MISKHLVCVFVILSTTAFSLRVGQEEPQSFLQAEVDSEQDLKQLRFITQKESKVKELNAIIGKTLEANKVQLTNVSFEVDEVQGDLEQATIKKAKLAAKQANGPVLVENVGLGFEALQGLPGPYIGAFSKKLKNEDLVKLLSAYESKKATATSVFVYLKSPESEPKVFSAEVKGTIVEPRGENGFGWDAIFVAEGKDKTYGELTPDEKNSISQRRLALNKFEEYVKSTPDWI
jgi:inosine triphosphate pyrophosphatase